MGIDFSSDETRARDKKLAEERAARYRLEELPFWKRSWGDNRSIAHTGIMRVVVGGALYVALAFGFILIGLKSILLAIVRLIDSIIGTGQKR